MFVTPNPKTRRPAQKRITAAAVMALEAMEARQMLAAFTPGDIVVYRVGTGTGSLVTTGNPVFIDEYSPTTGALVQPITTNIYANGTSTSEGFLSRSQDGLTLVVPGYAATVASGNINVATTTRVVDVVSAAGANDTTTQIQGSDFGLGNIRSAASDNGTNLWVGTSANGVRYATRGATTSTQLNIAPANARTVGVANGQLYVSSGSSPYVGVNTLGTGLPTSSGQTATLAVADAGTSPYGYAISPDGKTVYIADDGAVATTGGIYKFTSATGAAGSFTQAYKFGSSAGLTAGERGLTVDWSGANPVIYATTADASTKLVKITDTGSTATAATLATAAANTAFRGVALAPAASLTATTTTLTPDANPSTYGNSVNLTATVTGGATGNVTFKDGTTVLGTVALSGGVATCSASALSAGTHSLTAVYAGDSTHAGSTGTLSQVVNASSTVASITSISPTTQNLGQNVTFTATVTAAGAAAPTGSLAFRADNGLGAVLATATGPSVAGNVSTFSVTGSSLAVGTYSNIVAVYTPADSNFAANASSAYGTPLTINPSLTAVSLTDTSGSPTTYSQGVTFTISVSGSGTPTGSITLNDGGSAIPGASATLSGGTATITLSAGTLGVGTHSITASYAGDANNQGGLSSMVSHVVNPAVTTTSITDPGASNAGAAVVFPVTVTGSSPTGTVTLYDGATAISAATALVSGSASVTVAGTALTVGTHTITAQYSGDTNNAPGTSAGVSHVVNAPTVIRLNHPFGRTTGGGQVIITGSGFTGASGVNFGGTAATSYTVNSATQITATAPAGTGVVDVVVTNVGTPSATSAADQFTYSATDTIAVIESLAANTTPVTLPSNSVVTQIISQPGTVGTKTYTGWSFLVNDGTGSMDVFATAAQMGTYIPVVGDTITATGKFAPYQLLPELTTLTAISKTGTAAVPAVQTKSIPQASLGDLPLPVAGYPIKLVGVAISGISGTFSTAVGSANATLTGTITDAGGRSMSLFYTTANSSTYTNLAGQAIPTVAQDITGWVQIYNGAAELIPISMVNSPIQTEQFAVTGGSNIDNPTAGPNNEVNKGSDVTITVTRSNASGGDLSDTATVNYTIVDGTGMLGAVHGTDFSTDSGLYTGSLSFAADQATKTFTIHTAGPTTPHYDKFFSISFTAATGGGRLASIAPSYTVELEDPDAILPIVAAETLPANTAITLNNNPVVTAILGANSFMVNDGTGSMFIYGALPGGASQPAVGDMISVSGTYSPYHQIPELGSSTAPITAFTVISHNNPVPDSLTKTIADVNLGALPSSLAGYMITLHDVTISGISGSFGTANLQGTITDSSGSMTLYYWPTSYSVEQSFFNGVTIPTTPVTLTGFVSVYTSGSTNTAEFTPMSIVGVTPERYTMTATGGTVPFLSPDGFAQVDRNSTITVTVTRDSTSGAGSLDYSLVGDSAVAGQDYTDVSGTLNFADGEGSKSFTVHTLPTTAIGDRIFSIKLSNATGATGTLPVINWGGSGPFTFVITDPAGSRDFENNIINANATVQPLPTTGTPINGIRHSASGTDLGLTQFNMEGATVGAAYASFGVLDFNIPPGSDASHGFVTPDAAQGVAGLELETVGNYQSWCAAGPMNVYVVFDKNSSIGYSDSALRFLPTTTDPTGEGIGNQLGAKYLLGQIQYDPSQPAGRYTPYSLTNLDPTGVAMIRNAVAAGQKFRLVVAPGNATAAAAWAGSPTTGADQSPILRINYAPWLTGAATVSSGAVEVTGAGAIVANPGNLASAITVDDGGVLEIRPRKLDLSSFGAGSINVNGGMLMHADTGTEASALATQVAGLFGSSIVSSAAAADTTLNHGLSVLTGAEVLANGNSTGFRGKTIAATDVLVQYGWNGDLNMDGVVNYLDYGVIDNGYLTRATTRGAGDLTGDGAINYLDYGMMDNAFLAQAAPHATAAAASAASVAAPALVQQAASPFATGALAAKPATDLSGLVTSVDQNVLA